MRETLPFRILEHTADIGFEAFGATVEEVFSNSARALVSLIVDPLSIVPCDATTIHVESSGAENLLVNWLSEILYFFDAEGRVFRDFDVQLIDGKSLTAVARGERFDRARHQVNVQVKAITYHQLVLEQTQEGWHSRVYVDI